MRLNEISDADRFMLTLKGIRFDFNHDLENASNAFTLVGKSANRRNLLRNDIDSALHDIDIFLNQGYDANDHEVMLAKQIQAKLFNIKNQL